jgi:hypothetical protein
VGFDTDLWHTFLAHGLTRNGIGIGHGFKSFKQKNKKNPYPIRLIRAVRRCGAIFFYIPTDFNLNPAVSSSPNIKFIF